MALVTCILLNDEVLLKLISLTDLAVIAIRSVVSSLSSTNLKIPWTHVAEAVENDISEGYATFKSLETIR